MTWIILAITAHFFWAWVNIGDKYIVGNRVKNPYVYMVCLTMFGITGLLALPFIDFRIPDFYSLSLLVVGGLFYFFGGLPYIKAMQMEEPTRINVWWNLIPLFSLAIGWLFFKQSLSNTQIIAFVFLLVGAFIASIHASGKQFRFSKALVLMLISTFAFAIYGVTFVEATRQVSFLEGFVLVHIVMVISSFSLFLSKNFRKDFREEIKKTDKKLAMVFVGVGIIDHFGILLNQWALSLSAAALVFAFEGSQVLFVFIIATVISVFFPKIIKEEIDRKNIILKLAALVLMIVGILILNLK